MTAIVDEQLVGFAWQPWIASSLPSETLLASAKAWYATLRADRRALLARGLARFDRHAKDICCHVVIAHLESSGGCAARWRVVFEVRSTTQVVTLLADGNDPDSALQSGMFASSLALPMMGLPSRTTELGP